MGIQDDLHHPGEYDENEVPTRSAQMIWVLRALGVVMAGIVWLLLKMCFFFFVFSNMFYIF